MKQFIILTISILILGLNYTRAQKAVKITVNSSKSFCGFSLKKGYYSKGKQQYITHEASLGDASGIPDVVQEIQNTLQFDVPIKVYIAKEEDNCFASIGENGIRLIIADQLFLNKVNSISGTQWAAISIIAHEVGHHIAGFNRRPSQRESELDADYWSGYVLQKLGASKEAAVKCILRFGTEQDTGSHPNKYSRSATIKAGWDDAVKGAYDPDRCEDCE